MITTSRTSDITPHPPSRHMTDVNPAAEPLPGNPFGLPTPTFRPRGMLLHDSQGQRHQYSDQDHHHVVPTFALSEERCADEGRHDRAGPAHHSRDSHTGGLDGDRIDLGGEGVEQYLERGHGAP